MSCTRGWLYDPALFAFANAGSRLKGHLDGLTSLLPLGIIAGLFIGKPLGISLSAGWRFASNWQNCRRGHV
jgi:NhaA family Na+:H+ antiporter